MKIPSWLQLALIGLACLPLVGGMAALLLSWVSPHAPPLVPVAGERSTEFLDGTIRYQNRGEGTEATVFLHGFNGQLGDWNKVWEALDDCGRAIRLDTPGFGGRT